MKVGEWIKAQRLKRLAPENKQAWVADRMGIGQTTVSKWETGKSDVSRDELRRLEHIFGSTYDADKNAPQRDGLSVRLPVMGNIRARQQVEPALEPLEYIVPPPGTPDGARAVIVRGASFPPHKDGTALIFWAFVTDPAAFVGEICWVKLADGAEFVREIARGSRPGLWTLLGPPTEPVIADVEIAQAAVIEWTVRKPSWITPA